MPCRGLNTNHRKATVALATARRTVVAIAVVTAIGAARVVPLVTRARDRAELHGAAQALTLVGSTSVAVPCSHTSVLAVGARTPCVPAAGRLHTGLAVTVVTTLRANVARAGTVGTYVGTGIVKLPGVMRTVRLAQIDVVPHTLLGTGRTLVAEAVGAAVGAVRKVLPGVVGSAGIAVLQLGRAVASLRTGRTLVAEAVATAIGTGLDILAVAVVALVQVGTDTGPLRARTGTLTVGARERTVLGVDPGVVLTGVNLIAHTLDRAVDAVLETFTILTVGGLAGAVTAVQLLNGPLGSAVITMLRVVVAVVPAAAHTGVAIGFTVVAKTAAGVTSVSIADLVGIGV